MEPAVEHITSRYLRAVDEALPGFVQALYLTGSVALGAWQPPHSDIDAVVVTSRTAGVDDLAALRQLHADMPGKPHFDCIYVDQAAFAAQPMDCPTVPFVVTGEFFADKPCGELHPVLWLTLQRYGRTVRGPAVADLNIDVAPTALRRFNLNNLRTYWQPLAGRVRGFAAGHADHAAVAAELVAWLVLGPARLHYTLTSGDIISKTGAGAYLAEILPAWASLAQRAARWRTGTPESFVATDLLAAADSVDAVVNDAWSRWSASLPAVES
jgi:hypothetical protein